MSAVEWLKDSNLHYSFTYKRDIDFGNCRRKHTVRTDVRDTRRFLGDSYNIWLFILLIASVMPFLK